MKRKYKKKSKLYPKTNKHAYELAGNFKTPESRSKAYKILKKIFVTIDKANPDGIDHSLSVSRRMGISSASNLKKENKYVKKKVKKPKSSTQQKTYLPSYWKYNDNVNHKSSKIENISNSVIQHFIKKIKQLSNNQKDYIYNFILYVTSEFFKKKLESKGTNVDKIEEYVKIANYIYKVVIFISKYSSPVKVKTSKISFNNRKYINWREQNHFNLEFENDVRIYSSIGEKVVFELDDKVNFKEIDGKDNLKIYFSHLVDIRCKNTIPIYYINSTYKTGIVKGYIKAIIRYSDGEYWYFICDKNYKLIKEKVDEMMKVLNVTKDYKIIM